MFTYGVLAQMLLKVVTKYMACDPQYLAPRVQIREWEHTEYAIMGEE